MNDDKKTIAQQNADTRSRSKISNNKGTLMCVAPAGFLCRADRRRQVRAARRKVGHKRAQAWRNILQASREGKL